MVQLKFITTIVLSVLFAGILHKVKESPIQAFTQFFRLSEKYKLVIGILSARDNFAKREVIRSTWLKSLSNSRTSKEVKYLFIVADKDCEIPLAYRKTEFSCEEQNIWSRSIERYPSNQSTFNLGITKFSQKFVSVGFDFYVNVDLVITGFVINSDEALIQLWDLASEVLVVETKIDNVSKTYQKEQNIPQYLLPKGFVGSVVVFCGNGGCSGSKSWTQHYRRHPAVEISPLLRYSDSYSEFPDKLKLVDLDALALPAFIVNKFADEGNLEQHNINKEESFLKQKLENEKIAEKLKAELQHHNDILFVTDVDGQRLDEVYRNLPKKVVGFHHFCVTNFDVEFVMKTDDDSYLDVQKVLEKIKAAQPPPDSRNLWLGNFRHNWVVDRWGKWSEFEYTADVYPSFACGGGHVMSSKLSRFLSTNRQQLQYYQGEDTSTGIWFSALDVHRLEDNDWKCDDSCSPNMIVSTQHTSKELTELWENKVECGNPCGCLN